MTPGESHPIRWADYLAQLRQRVPRNQLAQYGEVTYHQTRYPLLVIEQPGDHCLVVTGGVHGDETAGPLTLLRYLPLLLQQARHRKVGLRLYPCVNPSGWEDEERGNADGFERNTNVVLQYDVNGVLTTELPPGHDSAQTKYRVNKAQLMPEMRLLYEHLVEQHPPAPWAQTGFLDLHQDGEVAGPRFYAYVFGDRARYRPLVRACRRLRPAVPPAKHMDIVSLAGSKVKVAPTTTDRHGLCTAHDASLSDYLDHQGVPYNVTLETTIDTPQPQADAVYLTWLLGLLHLVARG